VPVEDLDVEENKDFEPVLAPQKLYCHVMVGKKFTKHLIEFSSLYKGRYILCLHRNRDSLRFESLFEATLAMRILKNKMGLSCGLNEDKETLRNLRVSDEKY
jgi:hypothetical protein